MAREDEFFLPFRQSYASVDFVLLLEFFVFVQMFIVPASSFFVAASLLVVPPSSGFVVGSL
jgi:hypothetical protein